MWEESCGGLVLVMAVYGARNIPSCSSVVSMEDMWCGGASLAAVCLLACWRWAWYGVVFVVHCAGELGMVNAQSLV